MEGNLATGERETEGGGSVLAMPAAHPYQRRQHEESHAHAAEGRPAAAERAGDEQHARGRIQHGGGGGWQAFGRHAWLRFLKRRRLRRGGAFVRGRLDQLALWIARLSTAMAASCTASDRDGWAWQMRARSSAEPLNSMVSTPSWTSSDTFGPIRCMPSTRSVSAWAITFTKPTASAMATARPTAANGKLPALYGTPSALSCCSVLPTQAISGPV